MEWFSKNKHWITSFVFFGLSAALRFLGELRTVHPTGWDGYYYVMQVHSWITYGRMQAPDFSLIYPFFTLFTFISGDPVIGFKIGVAILAGLLPLSIYFYLIRKEVAWSIACLACSYVLFSPLITYFIFQFPKNTFGLILFIFFVTSLQSRNRIVACVLFVATILTHRMTGVFALMAVGLYTFRFISWKWIVAGVSVVIALGFLPGIIHISDFARFNNEFTPTPHWAPFVFAKIFKGLLDGLFITDLVLITIITVTVIVFVIVHYKRLSIQGWTWFLIVLISLFPFFQFSSGTTGYRFLMIAPVALILLMTEFIKPSQKIQLSIAGCFIVLSVFSYKSYKPSFDAPNEAYIPIVNRLVERYDPKTYPLVIVHKSLAEFIIFKTDFDALNWLPPDDILPENVLRITYRISRSDFSKYLDTEDILQVKTIAMNYFTIPENVWQKFVAAAEKDNNKNLVRLIYSEKNPMVKRPYFIDRGRTR